MLVFVLFVQARQFSTSAARAKLVTVSVLQYTN